MKKNPRKKSAARTGNAIPRRMRAEAKTRALPADLKPTSRAAREDEEIDPKTEFLESAPESYRWNPVPGSPGHQAPETPPEDEDREGRSETEQLVDEGVEEAERDQAIQARKLRR